MYLWNKFSLPRCIKCFFFTNVLENKGICKSQTADSQITHINKYVSQKMMGNCHERRDVIECCLEYLCLLVSTHCTGEQASSNMLSIVVASTLFDSCTKSRGVFQQYTHAAV